jgi:hypothetical protein
VSKKIFDMGKNHWKFIPEIWSQKLVGEFGRYTGFKFYGEPPDHIMVSVARRIEKLRDADFSQEDIEKDIQGYIAGLQAKEKETVKIKLYPWKTWDLGGIS